MKVLLAIFTIVIVFAAAGFIRRHRIMVAPVVPPSFPALPGSISAVTPGDYHASINTGGRMRTYILHIPKGFTPDKKYPLVLIFHGGNGTGARIEMQTGFGELADSEHFIAAFPDAIDHHWADGRGTAPAELQGVDDVAFVRALVEDIKRKHPVDDSKIFAAGVSNGGIFSHRVACEMADVFAAIASDVGPIATNIVATCNPARPISFVAIQGTADPLVPFKGGEMTHRFRGMIGGKVESADSSMKHWVAANRCIAAPKIEDLPIVTQDGTSVQKIVYSGCHDNTEVTYYIVKNMGHHWPPAVSQFEGVVGPSSGNLDATKVFWEFFKRHIRS